MYIYMPIYLYLYVYIHIYYLYNNINNSIDTTFATVRRILPTRYQHESGW